MRFSKYKSKFLSKIDAHRIRAVLSRITRDNIFSALSNTQNALKLICGVILLFAFFRICWLVLKIVWESSGKVEDLIERLLGYF